MLHGFLTNASWSINKISPRRSTLFESPRKDTNSSMAELQQDDRAFLRMSKEHITKHGEFYFYLHRILLAHCVPFHSKASSFVAKTPAGNDHAMNVSYFSRTSNLTFSTLHM